RIDRELPCQLSVGSDQLCDRRRAFMRRHHHAGGAASARLANHREHARRVGKVRGALATARRRQMIDTKKRVVTEHDAGQHGSRHRGPPSIAFGAPLLLAEWYAASMTCCTLYADGTSDSTLPSPRSAPTNSSACSV